MSFDDLRGRSGRGGPRPGAGRKPGKRPRVRHRTREELRSRSPALVTLRMRRGVGSLRSKRLVREFRRRLRSSSERGHFRVLEYSLQRDYAHFVIEADSSRALASGMKSLAARLARAVNRVFGRTGAVLEGRYHLRLLRNPRQMRNALRYVLLNVRHHWMQRFGFPPPARLDDASSARWFTGWNRSFEQSDPTSEAEVAPPRTWLARVGWRRHGLLDPGEVPGTAPP